MFSRENAANLLKTLKEVYDEHIVIKTRFEAVKDSTEKALVEYRRLNETLVEKLDRVEKERAKSEMEMLSKIASLEARLNAFSEKAMRLAVADVAERFFRDRLQRPSLITSSDDTDDSEK